jgi:hypothetical protein
VIFQTPHAADILLAVEGMDDASCAQEQQGFEAGMCGQMEDACGKGSHPTRHEHVSELTDGRIGQDALEIGLHQRDRCRQ